MKPKIGKLYFYDREDSFGPRFSYIQKDMIQNHIGWGDRCLVKPRQPVMIIEEFDFSEATATATATVTGMVTEMGTATVMGSVEDWDGAKKLWDKDKRIPGHKALVEDKVIWISKIDLRYFKEAEEIS